MSLFDKIYQRADVLEEARKSRFEDFFQTFRLKKEIEDKKLGVARPLVFEFIIKFLESKGLVPEGTAFKGSRYAAEVGEFLSNLIDQGLISKELSSEFNDYVDKNLGSYVAVKQQLRTRGKGEMVGKTFDTGEDFEQYKQVKSKEDFEKQQAELKAQKKAEKQSITAAASAPITDDKANIAGFKAMVTARLQNPGLKNAVIEHLLDEEMDDLGQAEMVADEAIDRITDVVVSSNTAEDLLSHLEQLIDSGNTAESMVATALFNVIKRKGAVTAEDEEGQDPREGQDDMERRQQEEDDRSAGRQPWWAEEPKQESTNTNSKKKLLLENNRSRFKAKTIHQQVQQQYDGYYL